jgi:hypothetical protein
VLQEGHCFSSTRDPSDATKYCAIDVDSFQRGRNGKVADGADVIELKKRL